MLKKSNPMSRVYHHAGRFASAFKSGKNASRGGKDGALSGEARHAASCQNGGTSHGGKDGALSGRSAVCGGMRMCLHSGAYKGSLASTAHMRMAADCAGQSALDVTRIMQNAARIALTRNRLR